MDQEIHLTPIEYRLLCLLARNCGKVLTHKYITQQLWGASWENKTKNLGRVLPVRMDVGPHSYSYFYYAISRIPNRF